MLYLVSFLLMEGSYTPFSQQVRMFLFLSLSLPPTFLPGCFITTILSLMWPVKLHQFLKNLQPIPPKFTGFEIL